MLNVSHSSRKHLQIIFTFEFDHFDWLSKRTCQDNVNPRNSPLISPLLPQTGTDFAHTSRTAFLTCWWYFFGKQCIEIPKNAILCVRVVSDQLFNVNGPRAQAQRDELVTRLSFEETVHFTLVQSPETLV